MLRNKQPHPVAVNTLLISMMCCGIAIFFNERVVEVSNPYLGTIKASAIKVVGDAKEISELRKYAEDQATQIKSAVDKANAANLEVDKIHKLLQPRQLTAEQISTFVNTVRDCSKKEIDVQYTMNNYESEKFAMQILTLLEKANYPQRPGGGLLIAVQYGQPLIGIHIITKPSAEQSADCLLQGLRTIGVNAQLEQTIESSMESPVQVAVGEKPN